MYRISFLILFSLLSLGIYAQLDNSSFYRFQKIDSIDEHNLKLLVSHLSFNKDNEYFNNIADGYTLFGNQLATTLIYFPAKNMRLEGGMYLRKDFGNRSYSEIAPIMSVKIKHNDLHFIFGTLEGSLNHSLVEPLYDFERIMLDKQESGIQFLLNKEKLDLDFWINWENMLYRGDTTQEKVSAGISSSIKIINNKIYKLSLPIQFTVMHLGGQIDASPLPLTSILNGSTGLKFEMDYNSNFLKGICFEPYYLLFNDFSFQHQDAFSSGNGVYLNLTFKTKINNIMISYWDGYQYISTHGGLLYNSRSTTYKNPNYTEAYRKLLIIRFLTDIKVLENLNITSRFEPFYDFNRKKIEFSLGLYINYNDEFFLKKILWK